VGIAVRPAADMTMARISRNAIYGNGQKIERCFAGCDPDIRKAASSSACRAASTNASASGASASLRRREASPRFARIARPTAEAQRRASIVQIEDQAPMGTGEVIIKSVWETTSGIVTAVQSAAVTVELKAPRHFSV
jgi:hypothetical protein